MFHHLSTFHRWSSLVCIHHIGGSPGLDLCIIMSILKTEGVQHHERSSDLHDSEDSTLKRFKSGRVKDPQPIDDANDPLNWSTTRKLLIIATVGVWIFVGTLSLIIPSPTFVPVSAELGIAFNFTSYLVSGPLLAYGMASLFWVATGNRYGVRLCFILSAVVAGCFSIWGAKAPTFSQLITARTLAAIAFASPETLGPQIVGDVFFLKDRAKCMSFVTSAQSTGFAAGALVGNFVVDRLGWRWTQWVMAILAFAVAILMFFTLPETQYTADLQFATSKRRLVQEFQFTRVSGGGRAKVHRYGYCLHWPRVHANAVDFQLPLCIPLSIPISSSPCCHHRDNVLLVVHHGGELHVGMLCRLT